MKVSIIIPYIRPELVHNVVNMAIANAGILPHEIIWEEDKERIGHAKFLNRMVEKTTGDLVCFLADDTLPQPDYLKNALEAMAKLPDGWGLVALSDGTCNGQSPAGAGRNLAYHWLADKRLLPHLDGKFLHEGYKHCCVDNELTERAAELSRYVWCNEALVIHNHPILYQEKETDEDYKQFYSVDWLAHDRELLKNRRENGWK